MTELSTKAEYRNGVLIPEKVPDFGMPDEVLVTFVKYEENGANERAGNAQHVLSLLDNYKGILPSNFQNGASYIADLRDGLSKEWEERFTTKDL